MKSIEGREVDERILSLLDRSEVVTLAAFPSYVTVPPGPNWGDATLLLTDKRMLAVRERLIRKPRIDFEVIWSQVSRVEGALWKGGGPKIQLLITTTRLRQPVELIMEPQHAVAVESGIRSGYLGGRSS